MKRLVVKLYPDKPIDAGSKYLVAAGKNFYSREQNKKHPLQRALFEKTF